MADTLPDPALLEGGEARLGPYRLVRPISAGGMARVYEGRLDSLAGVTTRVAIKVIHPDFANEAAFQELFITEARISARLEHQNLVRIQQFNREGHHYYLVMEYIDGLTFRKIISTCRKHRLTLPVQVIAELGRQVCEGLHYAHTLTTELGEPLHLVHRDVKPSNLMLNAHGVAKVLDFGISSASGVADNGGVKGTWGYMALEQAEGGAVGPAADVFGLATVLYELATLDPLFAEKENAVIRQRLLADVAAKRAAALAGPHADLGGVLVRALQRDPEARHRSAAVFGRALSTLVVDPVGVHDQLIRLFRDLRAVDGGGAERPAAMPGNPRSMPSMSRTGIGPGSPRIEAPPALPVAFGDKHGVSRRPPPATAERKPTRIGPTLAAIALLLVTVGVLGFSAWKLFFGAPRRAPVVATTPAATLPSPLAAVVEAPSPVVTDSVKVTTVRDPGLPSEEAAVAAPDPGATPVAPPAPTAPQRPPRAGASTGGTSAPTPPVREESGAAPVTRPGPTTSSPPVEPDAPVRIAPAASPSEAAPADGMLTVSSMPRAQVLIDGQYVRYTPLYQYEVSAGSHSILLVTEDGRRKSFKVEVVGGAETRKIWLFDEERWSEQ